GHYFVSYGVSDATLALPGAQSYFGMWWSAADSGNHMYFYSGSTLIGSFDSASAMNALTDPAYFNNPNPGKELNGTQKYAYLNFVGTNATTFDKILFLNKDAESGFEADNWSIRGLAIPPGNIPGTPIGSLTPTPEPATLMLAVSGLVVVVPWMV